jgi:type III restriction enzyme
MIEAKAKNEMESPEVLAKRDAAVMWCEWATIHAAHSKGKPWKYLLIPHDAIAHNITLSLLEQQFVVVSDM